MLFLVLFLPLAFNEKIEVNDACGKTVNFTTTADYLTLQAGKYTNVLCRITINFPSNMLLNLGVVFSTSTKVYRMSGNFTDGLNKTMSVIDGSVYSFFYPPSLTIDTIADKWILEGTLIKNQCFEGKEEHIIEAGGSYLVDDINEETTHIFKAAPGVKLSVFFPELNNLNQTKCSGLTTPVQGIFVYNGSDKTTPINQNITTLGSLENYTEISICTCLTSKAIIYDSSVLYDLPSVLFLSNSFEYPFQRENITLNAVKGPAILAIIGSKYGYFLSNFYFTDDFELHIYPQLPRINIMKEKKIATYNAYNLTSSNFFNFLFNKTLVVTKGSLTLTPEILVSNLNPRKYTKGIIRSDSIKHMAYQIFANDDNWYNYTFTWWPKHSRYVTLSIETSYQLMKKEIISWKKDPVFVIAKGITVMLQGRGTIDVEVTSAEAPID